MAKQDKPAERGKVTESTNQSTNQPTNQPTNPDGTPTDRQDGATVNPSAGSVGRPTTETTNS